MAGVRVKAYLGLGSRYAYLASTRLDRIARDTGAVFEWIPINSVALIRRAGTGGSPFDQPVLEGQYAPAFRDLDARRWAALYDVPYQSPQISALPADAMALACWCQPDPLRRRALMVEIFRAVFAEGRVMDLDALGELAGRHGVAPSDIENALAGTGASALHEQATQAALSDGVFGVPSFVCAGQQFWGNDRLPLLQNYLRQIG